ncbi:MAG TPA: YihY/virulence factor BrkB family protein [Gemmatimonadaceae bacterium]|nr:YihY/virulence factor BrkB family protein [Gemmatimonadaceae bacterium]
MAQVGVFSVLKQAFKDFGEDECSVRAAALAYFTIFALPPLLVLLITIAGVVWDPADVQKAIEGQFAGMLGGQAGQQVHEMVSNADRPDKGGALSTILSVAGLLFGATGAFMQLQGALNRAWEVKPDPEAGGIKTFITKRLLSLGMILAIGFLVAVSLALTAAVSAFSGTLGGSIPGPLLYVLDLALAFAVLLLLFGLIFKILPDATIEWRDAWVGAAVTAALFVVGKFAIGFYLGRGDKGDAYGAAGSLAVMLLWIYYAGMILLFGAEFTQAWASAHGRAPQPEEGAVKVVEDEQLIRPDGSVSKPGGTKERGAKERHRRPTGRTESSERDRQQGGARGPVVPIYATSTTPRSTGKGSLLLGASLLMMRLIGRKRA